MCGQLALCVDSNRRRQGRIGGGVRSLGFEVHKASTLSEAQALLRRQFYQLILICYVAVDSGISEFCSDVHSRTPDALVIVLMETMKVEVEARLFDCGVCDVVVGKQTCLRLLKKRLAVHLGSLQSLQPRDGVLRLNSTIVDFARREVWCNGAVRRLPGILGDLLKYFLDNPGRVISRKELEESAIWADSVCTPAEEGGKTFDVNIGKLRKIIELDASRPQIIQSVRGVGWKLAKKYAGGKQPASARAT